MFTIFFASAPPPLQVLVNGPIQTTLGCQNSLKVVYGVQISYHGLFHECQPKHNSGEFRKFLNREGANAAGPGCPNTVRHPVSRGGGGHSNCKRGYQARPWTHKKHPNHIFSGMKIDPKYAFLHAFFFICLSCSFQNLSI